MYGPLGNILIPRVVLGEDLQGGKDGIGLGRVEGDGLLEFRQGRQDAPFVVGPRRLRAGQGGGGRKQHGEGNKVITTESTETTEKGATSGRTFDGVLLPFFQEH